jgi:hypothetical protein
MLRLGNCAWRVEKSRKGARSRSGYEADSRSKPQTQARRAAMAVSRATSAKAMAAARPEAPDEAMEECVQSYSITQRW